MTQVFTHPYIPEENGQTKSFHKTLGKVLNQEVFSSIKSLEDRLCHSYTRYNNDSCHGSTKGLPPALFGTLYDNDFVDVKINEIRKATYTLKVALQDVHKINRISISGK